MSIGPFPLEFLMMRQVQTSGLPEHIQNAVFWSLMTTASDTYFVFHVWLFLLVEVPHHYSVPLE